MSGTVWVAGSARVRPGGTSRVTWRTMEGLTMAVTVTGVPGGAFQEAGATRGSNHMKVMTIGPSRTASGTKLARTTRVWTGAARRSRAWVRGASAGRVLASFVSWAARCLAVRRRSLSVRYFWPIIVTAP